MMSLYSFPRNIYVLIISQIVGMSSTTLVFLLGGIIGAKIASNTTFATLPITLMFAGLAVTTIPATMLMKRIGRKKAFIASALFSAGSTVLAAYALSQSNFFWFCVAIFLLGTHGAFIQQYRFAVMESVPKQLVSKAVGLLLMAGIVAAFLGPELAKRTKELFSLPLYTGSFLSLGVLFLGVAFLLIFLKDTKLEEDTIHGKERPFKTILTQPIFLLAILAASVGFGVMVFIMSATPVYLHEMAHYSLDHTAAIIQSHVIAMFLPSLVTGILIQKFGIWKMLLLGVVLFFITIFLGLFANSFIFYWITLVILGIGWNFLFIGSTVLLPRSYHASERFKVQGANDFVIVLCQMVASFLAGSLIFTYGWVTLNILSIPLLVFTFIVFLLFKKQLSE